MIDGYVNSEELSLITGFSKNHIKYLLSCGMPIHDFEVPHPRTGEVRCMKLFSLKEVENWVRVHIF